ncbi:MAG: NADH-quinone oxidoreductase subunit A [Planctomycetes bacterium]|nr:NADH-quinone oxidoreductase subunit A [Planctomycetota bacterium]
MLPLLGGAIPDNGPRDYLPVFLLLIVAVAVAGSQLFISWLLGPKTKPDPVKDSPYECGIEPVGEAHTRFSVKFYLVAVLFILFDIEIVFLYPWAVHFGGGAADGIVFATRGALVRFLFVEMLVFLLILFLGWYWVVKKKALDWEEA